MTQAGLYERLLAILVDHYNGPVPPDVCIRLADLVGVHHSATWTEYGDRFIEFTWADQTSISIGLEQG